MDFIKKFFRSKGVGYYLMAGAFVCGIVSLILYCTIPGDDPSSVFNSGLDASIIVADVIFIVLALAMCVYEIRIVKFAASAVGLYAFLMYIVYEINYIANLIAAIDGTPVSAYCVVTLVFGLAAWILALVSGCLSKSGFKMPKEQLS